MDSTMNSCVHARDCKKCEMRFSVSDSKAEEKKKPVKLEDVAEETGEVIGKGLRKAWNVTKSFGKGVADTIDTKESRVNIIACPCCAAPIPSDSTFCSRCGKKLDEK